MGLLLAQIPSPIRQHPAGKSTGLPARGRGGQTELWRRSKACFRRGEIWWLRYSVNGKQQRISLETNVETMPVLKVVGILQRAPLEASEDGLQAEPVWSQSNAPLIVLSIASGKNAQCR